VLSALGSGHFTSSVFEGEDGWRNLSFNANKRSDGTVTGQIQLKNRNTDQRVVGDEGAAMGEVVWAVRDNGQGANADPDQVTFWEWFPEGVGKFLCEDLATFFPPAVIEGLFIPIEAGNISVKTSD
jgi:hypothetical protein